MKKQRIMSLLLSLAMVFSMLPASALAAKTENFTDISKDDWYYKYVDFVADKGYFVGTSETTFSPEMSMTRAMFVVVLAALEGVKVDNNVSPFADVPANTWYSGAVKWAADKGVVAGIGDNKFAPDTAISREQMAVMMKAYVEWHSKQTGESHKNKSQVKSFKDAASISSWAVDGVEACRAWGLIAGAPDGNFYPLNTATRAEVATVIYNLAWMVKGGGGGGTGGGTGGDSHTHSFGSEWKFDETNHWHECSCLEKSDVAAHVDNDPNDPNAPKDHKCNVCGYVMTTCKDDNNDHKCDICEETMCPATDLLYNAIAASIADVKAGLNEQFDNTELDETIIAALEDGAVNVRGNDFFISVTGVKLGGENTCVICSGENNPHEINIDTVLRLKKDIINMYGLTYEMAVDTAKTLIGGIGYSAIMMTKDEAIATAAAIADEFEAATGIPVSKASVEKAAEILKSAAEDSKDFASNVWVKNFKNDAGYITGAVTFNVNGTKVIVNVDDTNGAHMTGSKVEAVVDLAVAVAKDLYNGLKDNASDWSTLPQITANEAFAVTVDVDFDILDNGNKTARELFTSCYPVTFSFEFVGDAFNYVQYKFDGINNVKIIVPQKAQDLYVAAANKLVKTVLVPYLSEKLQNLLPFGTSTVSLMSVDAAPAFDLGGFDLTGFDMNAEMQNAMDAWLSQNLTTGDISSSTLMGVINGTVDAEELDNTVIYDLIDSTMDNTLSSMLDGIFSEQESIDLAAKPEELDALLKDALGEETYQKLEDKNLVDYTIAKTQEYLDPNNTYVTPEIKQEMQSSVDKVVADTIEQTFNPSNDPADPSNPVAPILPSIPSIDMSQVEMYKKALNAVATLTSIESMTNVELSTLAAALESEILLGFIGERGDSIVSRVSALASYIPESASVTVAGMTVDAADMAALAEAESTVEACQALASILKEMGELSLSDFADEGQDITVSVGGKSVTFGLAIQF